jgi:hypothetical protein
VIWTVLGWLLVLKGTICFLAPSLVSRGMGKAGEAQQSNQGFALPVNFFGKLCS